MITTTHVALNGALTRWSRRGGRDRARLRRLLPDDAARSALLLGGLAPDVGLYVLSAGALAWFPATRGWDLGTTLEHVYGTLFFRSAPWIVLHNTLHAPLVLAALAGVGHAGRARPWGPGLRAFAVGCALHTALDVPTHVDDGPLLLFPFDWDTRFRSPVSYWDPAHHGDVLGPVDLAITVGLGGWLLTTWWRERRTGHDTSAPSPAGAGAGTGASAEQE